MAPRCLAIFSSILAALLFSSAALNDTSSQLLQGLNSYRASLNLSALTENQNAACLAEQIAKQFKGEVCSNTTGPNTVPGTEQQFPNYPDFLDHCHLNTTVTQDAAVLPACVANLSPDLVLTNLTKSQYNQNLNESKYVGAGIAGEGDWVVLVLSTNTPEGSFTTVAGAGSVLQVAFHLRPVLLLVGIVTILLN